MVLENSENNTDGANRQDADDPELQALMQKCLNMTFNSNWKVRMISALMHIPCQVPKGVKMMNVKGIGAYYFPSENSDECSANYSSAIMWIHGGGRIMGCASGAAQTELCSRIVKQFGLPVLSADYRLAPRHPFPAALDDIHAAYKWLVSHLETESNSGKKNEDIKIAVAGDSAGAGLAAELCQRLLDENQEHNSTPQSELTAPLPVCQILFSPMLDDRTCVDASLADLPPHFVWNHESNVYGWSSYLGPNCKPGDEKLPEYASASRRTNLSNLPPALIQVGDLDLFCSECEDYARRLKNSGVDTELVVTKGGFHGMMAVGKYEGPIVEIWERVRLFGKKFLLE